MDFIEKLLSSFRFDSIYSVFHMSMFEPATSNSFPERTQPAPILVIINGKPKYEISWIVDSKINCQQACKLLYKIIWLGYEDTGDKSEWIPTSELTHASNLVSDFYIIYPTNPTLSVLITLLHLFFASIHF